MLAAVCSGLLCLTTSSMITTISRKVFERMYDRKLASVIATVGGDLVTERTVRNWLSRHTAPDTELLERIQAKSQEKLRKQLHRNKWPPEEIQSFVDEVQSCPGFVSGFAFTLQNRSGMFPAFLQLAGQIDLLEQQLAEHFANGDVQGWAKTLLDAPWIRSEQLEDPDNGTSAEDTRHQLLEARSWEDIEHPAKVFFVNTLFQLLATLDLEFGAVYLSDWEATPIFASFLPILNPRVDLTGKTSIRITRNLYHYPARRLLDTIACMRAMRESPGRKWPSRIPAAAKMIEWLQLSGCDTLASNVAKWRSGRTLTAARFDDLWDAMFQFVPEASRPSVPMPILYAVTLFTELFVQGSLAKRHLTFVSPDPAYYLRWWNIQRQTLESGPCPPRFGTKHWMPALTRR